MLLAAREKRKAKKAAAQALGFEAVTGVAAGTGADAGGTGGDDTAAAGAGAAPQSNSLLAPQLAIIDGKLVVNTESLTVAAQQSSLVANAPTRRVVEGAHGKRLNAATYAPKRPNERWGVQETTLFYTALSQFGTDFSMIATLFPGRDRRAIKNKFVREEKQNRDRVEAALKWQLGGGGSKAYDNTGASATTAHLSAFLEKLEAQDAPDPAAPKDGAATADKTATQAAAAVAEPVADPMLAADVAGAS